MDAPHCFRYLQTCAFAHSDHRDGGNYLENVGIQNNHPIIARVLGPLLKGKNSGALEAWIRYLPLNVSLTL